MSKEKKLENRGWHTGKGSLEPPHGTGNEKEKIENGYGKGKKEIMTTERNGRIMMEREKEREGKERRWKYKNKWRKEFERKEGVIEKNTKKKKITEMESKGTHLNKEQRQEKKGKTLAREFQKI